MIDHQINTMDVKEFREEGFLQELNRQFLHPLGLALEISIDSNGDERLANIWDYREDEDGISFGPNVIDPKKIESVNKLKESKRKVRFEKFGDFIQQG